MCVCVCVCVCVYHTIVCVCLCVNVCVCVQQRIQHVRLFTVITYKPLQLGLPYLTQESRLFCNKVVTGRLFLPQILQLCVRVRARARACACVRCVELSQRSTD